MSAALSCEKGGVCCIRQDFDLGCYFGADEEELSKLKAAGFDSVEWDIALAAQNPHAIGVALKSGDQGDSGESIYEQRATKGSKARRKAAKAGFGKT